MSFFTWSQEWALRAGTENLEPKMIWAETENTQHAVQRVQVQNLKLFRHQIFPPDSHYSIFHAWSTYMTPPSLQFIPQILNTLNFEVSTSIKLS